MVSTPAVNAVNTAAKYVFHLNKWMNDTLVKAFTLLFMQSK